MAVTIGYIGATGRDIGYCGTNDCSININQIDPAMWRGTALPARPTAAGIRAKLLESVPQPVLRHRRTPASSARAGRSRAASSLRPFPEFGDILMHESTAGPSVSITRCRCSSTSASLASRTGGAAASATPEQHQATTSTARAAPIRTRTATPQNNYDLASEYGVSNSRFAAPHHSGAPVHRSRARRAGRVVSHAAPRRVDRHGRRGNGQRIAAERRPHLPARRTRTSVCSAAGSVRT